MNTQRNETNLHWRLNPLESNASFLAEQSLKNLSSKIAAQLKAQLKIKTQPFLFRAITKSSIFASPVLPPRTRGRQVTEGAIGGVREQRRRRRRRNVPRRASSDEEKPVEVMSRETNWPSASPTNTSRRSHLGGGAIACFSPSEVCVIANANKPATPCPCAIIYIFFICTSWSASLLVGPAAD